MEWVLLSVEEIAETLHERFAPDREPHWSDLDEDEQRQAVAWDMADAIAQAIADARPAWEAEVEARALESLADDTDREHAEQAARIRLAGVRCTSCDLRHEERQEYPCTIPGHAHVYDRLELATAEHVIVEPTYDGDEIRARAARCREGSQG